MKNNMENCSRYKLCSQNLCPLDFELDLRSGGRQDKCRYMREPRMAKIAGREFISGGVEMPTVSLNFVPECNLRWLNEKSKIRKIQLISGDEN